MLTIKAISQLLEDKKTNHNQINSGTFNFGDPWDYAGANEIRYPFFGARLVPGSSISNTVNGSDDITAIEIFLADLVKKDDSDQTQLLSDLKIIFLDLYAQLIFDLKNYFKANIDSSVVMNHFLTEFNNDEAIGWSVTLNIKQFFDNSTCSDISYGNAGKVIVYDSNGNVVSILNPNSVIYLDPVYTDILETFTLTGAANTTQALSQTPNFIYGVYKNGQKLRVTDDYTVSSGTITFLYELDSDKIDVVYNY